MQPPPPPQKIKNCIRQPRTQSTKEDHAQREADAPRAFTSPFCGLMFFFIFLYRFGREMLIHNALGN